MEHKRRWHACISIAGNNKAKGGVYVIGGMDAEKNFENTIEKLEFGANKWVTKGEISGSLADLLLQTVAEANSQDYILYSIGGNKRYDTIFTRSHGLYQYRSQNGIYGLTHSYEWKLVGNLINGRIYHTSLNMLRKDIPNCPIH